MHPIVILAAACALVATLPAIFLAWLTKVNICGPNCHDGLINVQFIAALIGVVPAGVFLFAATTGRRRLAVLALVIGVFAYASWGLLNDAAVHGWNDLW